MPAQVPESEPQTEPEMEVLGTPKAPRPPSRALRIAAAVLPAVLVLGAAVGGLVYTKSTVDKADTTAPTTVWGKDPKPPADPADGIEKGRHDSPLSMLLLPVPSGYKLGPDLQEFGNDSIVSGKQAEAMMKDDGKGLAGKQRREWEKRVEKLGPKGLAFRSYTDSANDLDIEVRIMQLKDKKAVAETYRFRKDLMDSIGLFRDGPKITGHTHASCFLPPNDKKSKLEAMVCTAYEGGALVTLSAYGTKPFDKSEVANLLKKQIDHIASPGEYV
ncbi:hypothetical protein GCM10009612_06810 [Streptomyces beijiangensis]